MTGTGTSSRAFSIAERLLAVLALGSVALFPLTAAVKQAYRLKGTWVNPSLLLGALALASALLLARRHTLAALRRHAGFGLPWGIFAGVCFLSAALAGCAGGEGAHWREPVRFALVLCVGLLPLVAGEQDDAGRGRHRLLALLAWVGVAELLFALYALAAVSWHWPLPVAWLRYTDAAMGRQTFPLFCGGLVVLPRPVGTFYEAPALGLFLFCAYVAADRLAAGSGQARHGTLRAFCLVGTVLSLSSQVLAGLAVYLCLRHRLFDPRRWLPLRLEPVLAACLCVALASFVGTETLRKAQTEKKEQRALRTGSEAVRAYGRSLSERRYHARRLLDSWRAGDTRSRLFGRGPGSYAARTVAETAVFETRVTPQILYAELLGETGLLGLLAFLGAAGVSIGCAGRRRDLFFPAATAGVLLTSTSLQANWRSEPVFFLLGLLYALRNSATASATARGAAARPARLLIFKLAGVGDLLLASPAVRACRRSFPAAHITLLTGESNRGLYTNSPHVDAIETVSDRRLLAGGLAARLAEAWRLWRRLRALRPDIAFVLHRDWRYNLLFRVAGIPRRYGFAHHLKGCFLTRAVFTRRTQHDTEKYLQVLALADGFQPDGTGLDCFPGAADPAAVDALLAEWRLPPAAVLVALAPGGAVNVKEEMAVRRWPAENYAELAGRLLAADPVRQLVLVGGPGDRPFARRILDAHPAAAAAGRIRDATGRLSLHGTVLLLRHCALLVTHDCGPLHLGAVAGIPVLALYGPTVPAETAPQTPGTTVLWRQAECACIPCYRQGQMPRCTRNRCLAEILPAEVAAACERLLAAPPAASA